MSNIPASSLRSKIVEIDDHIQLLLSQISALQTEKTELECLLGAVVYPVLTLPPEITSEIFKQAVAAVNPFPPITGMAAAHNTRATPYYPLTVASVCVLWRDVALSCCELWNRLTLAMDSWQPTTAGLEALFECYVSRAGNLPLDICILFVWTSSFSSLWDSVCRVASRWRVLDLRLEQRIFGGSLKLPLRVTRTLEQLERLSVKGDLIFGDTEGAESISTPNLRQLSIDHAPFSLAMRGEQMLQGVTTLSLHSLSAETTMSILRCTPAIEVLRLSIDLDLSSVVGNVSSAPLILPAIHSLFCGRGAFDVLQHTSLPALRSLELEGVLESFSFLTLVDQLVARSQCRVHSLALRNPMKDRISGGPDLADYLRIFPHTKRLRILLPQNLTLRPAFRGLVRPWRERNVLELLPELETLTLRGPHHETHFERLLDFVKARQGGSLKRVAIQFLQEEGTHPEVYQISSLDGVELELSRVSSTELEEQVEGE
ncbi:hypothetical protein C8F01DRAFT_1376909 [Mycena amicta]|nr:hypothetical protein C8F01DRAFT_1376909 [Mycena amicta]